MSNQHAPSAARAPAPPAQAQHGETKQPGMIAQMAATAGSVAVGSTIGHGLSSMLFGGGSGAAPPVEQQQPPAQQQQGYQQGVSCEVQAKGGCLRLLLDLWGKSLTK
jgi:coiled-coil-helix-coiled-coil-helix domain-containing protein 2